ncbi:MAG: DinB family protein [Anaerolineales bacterium]|nr:DinB family protein [Anaerolineales bacterium]
MPDKYLPIEQILAILGETPSRLVILSAGLSSAQLHTAPEPGEWSASEILAHLRACSDVWGDKYILTIVA